MDSDALQEALDRWTDEGLIDPDTADRIREHEEVAADDRTGEGEDRTGEGHELPEADDRRLVVALALMGGALVAVGAGAFLVQQWTDIPVPLRVLVLLTLPLGAAAGGARIADARPRTGHGLWLLAAVFAGVTLFGLADLASPISTDAAEPWLLAAWTAAALLVAGHLDSRPATGLGVLLGLATLVSALTPWSPTVLVGFYGVAAYAAGHLAGDGPRPRQAATLRWLGGTLATVALVLAAATADVAVVREGVPWGTTHTGTLLVAVAATLAAGVALLRADGREDRYAVAPAVTTPLALAVVWAVDVFLDAGDVAVAVVALAALLAVLLSLVAAAVGRGEPTLVNVATLGFVLGVFAFLVGPLVDVVSGPLALVAVGVVLLGVGYAVERGRRAVLARLA
ncbi:hypothetical protein JCM17823_19070 [Halorubrum gandharaense]